MDLNGKKVLVTGGANGIGKCLVGKIVERGATVAVLDIDEAALRSLHDSVPSASTRVCDITQPAHVESCVSDICSGLGSIDVLVNNAGVIYNSPLIGFAEGTFKKHDVYSWDRTIAVNLSAVFYMTASVSHRMVVTRTRGVIVNVSSICAAGNAGQSAYSAAKAGVSALTVTWAKELSAFGIRVAAVAPGFTETESLVRSTKDSVLEDWIEKTASRRMAKPTEIADGIMFIIENDFCNGRVLELDGGLRI